MSAFLSTLLETMEQAACLSDPSGAVVAWNEAAFRLTGYPAAEVLGQPWRDFLSFPTVKLKNGDSLSVEHSTAESGEGTVHLFWVSRSDQALLTAVTHDLRGPLSSILGFARLAEHPRHGEISPKKLEFVRTIHRSGEALGMMIANLALATSLDRGVSPEFSEVALEGLFTGVAALFEGQTKVPLQVSGEGAVRADRGHLRQILYNLVSNAVRNTEQGSIQLTSPSPGEIVVEDTGPGLPADFRIARFGCAPGHKRGLGLGLFVAQGLLEAQGSRLELHSVGGKGTRASFRLPPVSASLRLVVAGPAPELAAQLEAQGHHVVRAGLGMEALAVAAQAQLVFCREPLPDMAAFDLRQALHENPTTAGVPLVYVGTPSAAGFAGTLAPDAAPEAVARVLSSLATSSTSRSGS